jgi:N-acyl-D-aspartate/D-glutamate deacylase
VLDVVIRGGNVVDGTGAPQRRADVGIDQGRVVAIGDDVGTARRVVDATDRIVAPGFVDVHTHVDAQAFWDPTLGPSPLHGVTTVFGGNCGFSIAPLDSSAAGYLMQMLAIVEGMPLAALEAGVPWDWNTTEEYLDRLDGTLAINAGFMVGHSAIRRVVMGEAATERTSTPEELARMQALLRAGLRAGGIGFSTTRSRNHVDASGTPVPSRFADMNELVALAAVCREFEGTSLEYLPSTPAAVDMGEADVANMIEMSRQAQRPINWNLLRVSTHTRDRAAERLDVGRRSLERGARVVMLVMPLPAESVYNFGTGFALSAFPEWAEPMALPAPEKIALLRSPEQRRRLAKLAASDPERQTMANWGLQLITETFTPDTKPYQGRVVGDIAAEEGKEPFDTLLDIVIADGLRTYFRPSTPEETRADWEFRAEVARDHRALIGGSDAGAHLDMMSQHNYTTRVLANFVRNHQVATIEETVHLLTGAPARLYGVRNRGVLREGAAADVVIFDQDQIDTTPLVTRPDLPGGASRLYTDSVGIERVLVNGVEIVEDGKMTDARPGTLLRSGRDLENPPLVP